MAGSDVSRSEAPGPGAVFCTELPEDRHQERDSPGPRRTQAPCPRGRVSPGGRQTQAHASGGWASRGLRRGHFSEIGLCRPAQRPTSTMSPCPGVAHRPTSTKWARSRSDRGQLQRSRPAQDPRTGQLQRTRPAPAPTEANFNDLAPPRGPTQANFNEVGPPCPCIAEHQRSGAGLGSRGRSGPSRCCRRGAHPRGGVQHLGRRPRHDADAPRPDDCGRLRISPDGPEGVPDSFASPPGTSQPSPRRAQRG